MRLGLINQLHGRPDEDKPAPDLGMEQPLSGSSEEIAEYLLGLGELGFVEMRCDIWPKRLDAIRTMEPVVTAVHNG